MTTKKPSLSHVIVALMGVAVATAPLAQAAIIYDNSTTAAGTYVSPASLVGGSFSTEYGNQITFAGTARQFSDFKFQYFLQNGSGDETARLRIYANDGAPLGNGVSATPGTLLYDSTAVPIQNSKSGVFDVTGVSFTLPNTVTWTVSFGGVHTSSTGGETNEVVGLLPYTSTGTGTGTAFNDMWVNVGGTWQLQSLTGNATATFAAQVSAVPEPTVVQLGLLAGAAGLGMMRLRRRS